MYANVFFVAFFNNIEDIFGSKYPIQEELQNMTKTLRAKNDQRGRKHSIGGFNLQNEVLSEYLSIWKSLYNSRKAIYLSLLELKSSLTSTSQETGSRFNEYDRLIDLNLNLLLSLEDMKPNFQDIDAKKRLTSYVARVIEINQNPVDCGDRGVIGYVVRSDCGFACQIHKLAHTLTIALGQGKPLVIEEIKWHEFNSIYDIIAPLSNSCRYKDIAQSGKFSELVYDFYASEYAAPAIPEELKDEIAKFHTDPFLWFWGQIIAYILRLYTQTIDNLKLIHFKHPIVGRTDKLIWEAKYYSVSEYMKAVDLYYRKIELKNKILKRYVFLSSDVPSLIEEFRKGYPNYVFINSSVPASKNRKTKAATYSILSDIYHLSQTDYLVCTMSSNVCRLAYELMNNRLVDASENYFSLDYIFYQTQDYPVPYILNIPHSVGNIHLNSNKTVFLNSMREEKGMFVNVTIDKNKKPILIPTYKLSQLPKTKKFKAFENVPIFP